MSSPTKTWISVILGITVVYFLYYSIAQIVDSAKALENQGGPKPLWTAGIMDCELYVGLIGTGCLIALYIIATLVIFLNKREKHPMYKGQLICYIMIGVLLALAFASSSMVFVERYVGHPMGNPDSVLITTIVLSCFRLLLAAGIVGCGVHALKHDHS